MRKIIAVLTVLALSLGALHAQSTNAFLVTAPSPVTVTTMTPTTSTTSTLTVKAFAVQLSPPTIVVRFAERRNLTITGAAAATLIAQFQNGTMAAAIAAYMAANPTQ